MTKYRVGDEVMVRGTISCGTDGPRNIDVMFDTMPHPVAVREDMIATHTPKPRELKIGDIVGLEGAPTTFRWVVLALHDDWAWLLGYNTGAMASARKIQIVRA